MFRLLAIEWLKLRGYRPFWALMILFAALLFLTNFVICNHFFIDSDLVKAAMPDYSFPKVWDTIGFWVRVLGGLIPVFIIISTTNEIQYRTNRQNVIDGWSRAEFFHAKWLSCVVVALTVTLYSGVLGAGFGLIYRPDPATVEFQRTMTTMVNGMPVAHSQPAGAASQPAEPVEPGQHLDRLLYVFLLVLNYTALAMTLSFFLKRGVLVVILFVCFCYLLEPLTAAIVNAKVMPNLGTFFPLETSAGLLPAMHTEEARRQLKMAALPAPSTLALASCGWLVFYYLVGWWKLRRSDW